MNIKERRNILFVITGVMFVVTMVALLLIYLEQGRSAFESLGQGREIKLWQTRDFYVYDYALKKEVRVAARCVRIGKSSVVCVEPSVTLSSTLLDRIRDDFDESIYNNAIGTAPADKYKNLNLTNKIVILLLEAKRGRIPEAGVKQVAGYYSKLNEQARFYNAESNQARIIHVFIEPRNINDDSIMETVAHEARHLKNWSKTRNNVGLIIGSLFAIATVATLYLGLSHLYFRSFRL
ncbi:MAG: hypothetical protein WC891_04765 [Actinomycetota bacterium]